MTAYEVLERWRPMQSEGKGRKKKGNRAWLEAISEKKVSRGRFRICNHCFNIYELLAAAKKGKGKGEEREATTTVDLRGLAPEEGGKKASSRPHGGWPFSGNRTLPTPVAGRKKRGRKEKKGFASVEEPARSRSMILRPFLPFERAAGPKGRKEKEGKGKKERSSCSMPGRLPSTPCICLATWPSQ